MSKRHLTQQQHRNIADAHQHVLQDNALQTALVVTSFGKSVEIETDSGERLECHVKQTIGQVVVGDRVRWQYGTGAEKAVVIGLEPRHHLLTRPDRYKQSKAIAANIDQILIIVALVPEPIWYYLDKYLLIAELQKIPAVIVLNKQDLVTEQAYANLLADYQRLGYPLYRLSALMTTGIPQLLPLLANKTSIVVGQSGAGKSTLLNALIGEEQAKTAAVSSANRQKGRHTTTTARLYHLTAHSQLIDSPGIREFGVWHIDTTDIVYGFREFLPYLGQCQFRNCSHQNAKGCALSKALAQGLITPQRWQSYQRMLQEIGKVI